MKEILISIQAKWVAKILNGEKTIEIRKTMPKCELPCKVYIYCTKQKPYIKDFEKYNNLYDENGVRFLKFSKQTNKNNTINGKVVSEFTLNQVTYLGNVATDNWRRLLGDVHEYCKQLVNKSCLTETEMLNYKGHYAWHISNLKIYDKPKELSELGISKAPQSWQYVKKVQDI